MEKGVTTNGTSHTRRSQRYDIVAPVRFRSTEGEWLEGTTVNICARGVLIRTKRAPPPQTLLELRIALLGDEPASGAHVACWGQVVRSERSHPAGDALMAVTIDDFQLRPAARRNEENG